MALQTYSSQTTSVTYEVPAGYKTLIFKVWGTGGGGGAGCTGYGGGNGGGGSYVTAEIPVIPGEMLDVRIGRGASGKQNPGYSGDGGDGGGITGIFRAGAPLVIAGSGGGGGGGTVSGGTGYAGAAGNGLNGQAGIGQPGQGGTQTAGGSGGSSGEGGTGEAGLYLIGGGGANADTGDGGTDPYFGGDGGAVTSDPRAGGGGGGAGFFGGGGGGAGVSTTSGGSGGGSGSSFVSPYATSYSYTAGSGTTAGNSADSDRPTNAGNGGTGGAVGENGGNDGVAGAVVILAGQASGTGISVKDAGVWKDVLENSVKDAGTWKPTTQVSVKDAGVWKPLVGGGGATPITNANSASDTDTSNLTTYNFTLTNINANLPSQGARTIVIFVHVTSASPSITAVTAGPTGSLIDIVPYDVNNLGSTTTNMAFETFVIPVDKVGWTAANIDVQVTAGASCVNAGCRAYAFDSVVPLLVRGSDIDDTLTGATVDPSTGVLAGDAMVSFGCIYGGDTDGLGPCDWSGDIGVLNNSSLHIEGGVYQTGKRAIASADDTNFTCIQTWDVTPTQAVGVCVALTPAWPIGYHAGGKTEQETTSGSITFSSADIGPEPDDGWTRTVIAMCGVKLGSVDTVNNCDIGASTGLSAFGSVQSGSGTNATVIAAFKVDSYPTGTTANITFRMTTYTNHSHYAIQVVSIYTKNGLRDTTPSIDTDTTDPLSKTATDQFDAPHLWVLAGKGYGADNVNFDNSAAAPSPDPVKILNSNMADNNMGIGILARENTDTNTPTVTCTMTAATNPALMFFLLAND